MKYTFYYKILSPGYKYDDLSNIIDVNEKRILKVILIIYESIKC